MLEFASLSDMVFTIQCGLCPELFEIFHRYVQGREANCLIHTGFQFISFERNRHAVDFHIRDFLGHLKRHLLQVCDADQQKGTLAALL